MWRVQHLLCEFILFYFDYLFRTHIKRVVQLKYTSRNMSAAFTSKIKFSQPTNCTAFTYGEGTCSESVQRISFYWRQTHICVYILTFHIFSSFLTRTSTILYIKIFQIGPLSTFFISQQNRNQYWYFIIPFHIFLKVEFWSIEL